MSKKIMKPQMHADKNIFADGELLPGATVRKIRTVQHNFKTV